MASLTVNVQKTTERSEVTLIGSLDENAKFPAVITTLPVVIDLSQLETMNSSGLVEWFRFMKTLAMAEKVIFRKIPPLVVSAANSVHGFIPKNGAIESFYVPYATEDGEKEMRVLVEVPKSNFKPRDLIQDQVTGEDGLKYEVEIRPDSYVAFLKVS